MATSSMSERLKWPKRTVMAFICVISLYLGAALIGSIFPANQYWKSPDVGIELFVETNGLHTGVIMPMQNEVHDWTNLVRQEDLADPARYGSHILVGWGHEGVYRNAEHWQNLRFADAASAVLGSKKVLLHVYHLKYPQDYPHYRRSFRVTKDEYRKIVAAIEDRFVLDSDGRPNPSKGYGQDDLFYEAKGYYTAFYTCNNWTGDILRQAGIRMGRWTPFQGGVMRWFPEHQPKTDLE